jgi:hypothetical protein
MAYIPDANDQTQPVGSVDASTADEEFRAIKTKLNQLGSIVAYWNSLDIDPSLVLSGGNLIVTKASGIAQGGVRNVVGKSSNKWYWELTMTALAGIAYLGVLRINSTLANFVGFDGGGFGYRTNDGFRVNANAAVAYGSAIVQGDVVGVAMDLDTDTITFYKNNVSQGAIYAGLLTGTFYPAVSMVNVNDQITANFGSTSFVYTPPSGYSGLNSSTAFGAGSSGLYDFYGFM